MRAVFVHDNYFITSNNTVYAQGYFDYSCWKRYLDVFDSLVVIGRHRNLKYGEDIQKLTVSSGPRVSFLFVPNLASPTAMIARRPEAIKLLTSAISSADAVIARLPSQIGCIATTVARRLDKPWAVEVVGCAWDGLWNYGTWQGKVYAPVAYYQNRQVIKKAPFAIYVTQRFLQHRYPSHGQVAVASNVQIPVLEDGVMEQRLCRISAAKKQLVIGLIGSLSTRYKGVHTALEALAYFKDQLPSFEFRVLGPGDPQSWVRLAESLGISDCVRFCKVLPSGEPVRKWLDEVDIYLQPSFQEGLPRSLLEAMSRGCPAIGSTAGGIPELLTPECLHKPGDVQRLGKLLVKVANDSALQADMATQNFNLTKEYSNDVLELRRRHFWQSFADSVAKPSENRAQ